MLCDLFQPEKPLVNILDGIKIIKDPYGVVLVMGAWNYPLQLTLLPMQSAIAAGNCVIIKPSEVAPASAKFMADFLPKYLDNVSSSIMYATVYSVQCTLQIEAKGALYEWMDVRGQQLQDARTTHQLCLSIVHCVCRSAIRWYWAPSRRPPSCWNTNSITYSTRAQRVSDKLYMQQRTSTWRRSH